jgi:succinoglycan biosynthesis transport protein ExoP
MLHLNRPLTVVGGGKSFASETTSPAELVSSFTRFFGRQFPIILLVALLSVGIGVAYVLIKQPVYTAQALMIIDTHKLKTFQKQEVPSDNAIDSGMVDSEVEILRSENITLAVINRFHLTTDPEFIGRGGGFVGALPHWVLRLVGLDAPKGEYELKRRAVAAFTNRLTVKRVRSSYIIQISFDSLSAQRAADIANAIAEQYIVDQLESKLQSTRQAGVWLKDRLRELSEQASTAQRAVVEFKAKNNIVNTGGPDKRLVNEQQVSELNSQLVIARAQVSESRARLDRIEAVLRADSPDATVDATVADTLKNDVITKLRSQYLELAAREADWSTRYGKTHLAVVNIRNQMGELRNSILNELRRIAESYKSDYEIAKQRLTGIEQELGQAVSQSQVTNRAEVELTELESNAKSYRALYDDFLQRYMETVQQQSFPITEARVVTPAARPLTKSQPQTVLALLISAAGGLILGFGLGHLRDLSDRVFRTRSQVESLLARNCLATVPRIKLEKPQASLPRRNENELANAIGPSGGTEKPEPLAKEATDGSIAPQNIVRRDELLWQAVDFPLSPFAESIRSIKMAVHLAGPGKSTKFHKQNKILGITSSLPSEGKSTIAASLAQLMSQSGKRVILIDGDLRAPRLTRAMARDARAGLLEVTSGETSLDEVIWTDPSTNLSFLPVVSPLYLHNTAEILSAEETKVLFDRLRKTYDYVIVDLAPLVPNVDVRATRGLVDYYVFVVEWGRTKIEVVERALKDAPGIYDRLLGVVLNKVDSSGLRRHEGYDSYIHYKYYQYRQ